MKRENQKISKELIDEIEELETSYFYVLLYMTSNNMKDYLSESDFKFIDSKDKIEAKNLNIKFIMNYGTAIYQSNNNASRHLFKYIPIQMINSMVLIAKENIKRTIKEKEQLLETL